jgi:hypothetical protein
MNNTNAKKLIKRKGIPTVQCIGRLVRIEFQGR